MVLNSIREFFTVPNKWWFAKIHPHAHQYVQRRDSRLLVLVAIA